MHPFIKRYALLLLPVFAVLMAWACTGSETEADQYLTWHLTDAYKDYDTVSIKLVATGDTTLIYEVVWNAKIPEPSRFPKYRLTAAKGKDFTIQIRCYNAAHELVLSKDVDVAGANPKEVVTLVPDVRLLDLAISAGLLTPAFSPEHPSYTAQVEETVPSIVLTASPLDAGNVLTINRKVAAWGTGIPVELQVGANVIEVTVSSKDGKASRDYELVVTRGRVIPPEEVTAVSLKDSNLVLYTGDAPTAEAATPVPVGALLTWTSANETIVRVDGSGNLTPVGPGSTTVTVKAGNHSAQAAVTVKKDVPVIDAGKNIAVKVGAEVAFNISVSQEHGIYVSFKYDLDGDSAWDNADTAAPAPSLLKHTYANPGTYTARFYAKDGEGNIGTATRTITVSDGAFLLAIVTPGRDTLVNATPFTVVYEVNGTLHSRVRGLIEGINTVAIDTGIGSEKVSATVKITLDTQAPAAPAISASTPTTNPKPVWTWTTGGGGNLTFRYRLDSADLASAPATTANTYTPSTNLSPGDHVLYVAERDAAGNWSKPGSFKVTIVAPDNTPPNAPKISGTSPTNVAPKWFWTTGGGGGAGFYRYKLDDTTLAGAAESRDTLYTLPTATVSGTTYKLFVAERDSAGNWSRSTGFAILFDNTKPTVAILAPQASGTYLTKQPTVAFSGTATGPNPIVKVIYKVNTVYAADAVYDKGAWSIASIPALEGSITVVTVVATDNLGNTGEASVSLVRDNTPPSAPVFSASPATPTNLAKGSWAWSAGTDPSGGSGLSGLYRFSLDGGVTWKETSATLVNDLPLAEGNNSFNLQEQDLAGNWSVSAVNLVKADFTGPKVAVTSPAAGATLASIHATLTGTVTDAGTSVQSVIVAGPFTGSGIAVLSAGAWTTGDLVLRTGPDTLTITATDLVGNSTKTTLTVTVSVAAPQVTITYPPRGFITNKDTVTIKYTVIGGADYAPIFTMTKEGGNLYTATSPKNEAGQTGSDTITIIRDVTNPNPPTLTAAATPTNGKPTWNWVATSDNAGGTGLANPAVFRYQLNGAGAYTVVNATNSFALTPAPEGTYSLVVQQMDRAGNWSANSASIQIVVDITGPVVDVKSPADGLITSNPNQSLVCKLDGVDQPPIPKTLTAGSNTLTCSYKDAAQNPGSKSITVWYVPNTWFVKKNGAGAGTGWADPLPTIQAALAKAKSGDSIWIAAGVYNAPADDSGFHMISGVSLYASFSNTGTMKRISDRTFGTNDTTYILNPNNTNGNVLGCYGKTGAPIQNVTIDGLQVIMNGTEYGMYLNESNNILIKKVRFYADSDPTNAGIQAYNTNFTVDSCRFNSFSSEDYPISTTGDYVSTVSVLNTTFSGNVMAGFSGSIVNLYGYAKANFYNDQFLDAYPAKNSNYYHIYYYNNTGELDVDKCTFNTAANESEAMVWGSATKVFTSNTYKP